MTLDKILCFGFITVLTIVTVEGITFYPFGTSARDQTLASQDDGSTAVQISFDFPFFGNFYRQLFISTNGIITFGTGVSSYTPRPFPLTTLQGVAAYWTDSDPSRGGDILYREEFSRDRLQQITQEIRSRFVQHDSFTSTWALIVTFNNVSAYGCGRNSPAPAEIISSVENEDSLYDIPPAEEITYDAPPAEIDCEPNCDEFEYDDSELPPPPAQFSQPDSFNRSSNSERHVTNARTANSCETNCRAVVNHQTILTSNGISSFAIFLYDRLDYTAGRANCQAHAQVGFNAGDGKQFFLIPSSNTLNVPLVALRESNVGVPGKWMFSIGEEISEVCNSLGFLVISPKKLLYFGNQELYITGPCFSASDRYVTVYFAGRPVDCDVVDDTKLKCSAPLFEKMGRVSVKFQHNNMYYSSFVVVAGPEHSLEHEIESFETDPNAKLTIRWNPNLLPGRNNLTIRGYQMDYYFSSAGEVTRIDTALHFANITNTGQMSYLPEAGSEVLMPPNKKLVRKVMMLIGEAIASTSILIEAGFSNQYCLRWHLEQPSRRKINDIVDEVSRRNPCPPAVPSNFPAQITNFVTAESCNPSNRRGCEFFHPGAKGCYRGTNAIGAHVAQCCYNDQNELIIGPPGGGTLDWVDPAESISNHFVSDILPYIACCKNLTIYCELYHEKRPSIDSRHFVRPRPTRASGDPHFTTIDGTSYDFNPIGEFIYFRSGEDEIQTRISQYKTSSGRLTSACYFSAFVFKSNQSDTIQVELTKLQTFTIRVNRELLATNERSWTFNNIYLDIVDNKTLSLQSTTGIQSEIIIASGMLHLIIFVPQILKGKVSGLIGNWDDDKENDLMLPDGTWIPRNSSNRDIHFNFGMKWSTKNDTSLFTYPEGLTWSDYQNPSFTPDFSDPPPNNVCGNDMACLYDVNITGDERVGLSNIVIQNRTKRMVSEYQQMSETCPIQVSIVNGKITMTRIPDSSAVVSIRYLIECHDDLELEGSREVTCTGGKFSSNFGACMRSDSQTLSNYESARVRPQDSSLEYFMVVVPIIAVFFFVSVAVIIVVAIFISNNRSKK